MNEIKKIIIDSIKSQMGVERVSSVSRLHDDLHMDELDKVEVTMEIEDILDNNGIIVSINDTDIDKAQTVQDIIDIVKREVGIEEEEEEEPYSRFEILDL